MRATPSIQAVSAGTLLVTASGIGFFGIGGAFWGLVAGGLMVALARWRANRR